MKPLLLLGLFALSISLLSAQATVDLEDAGTQSVYYDGSEDQMVVSFAFPAEAIQYIPEQNIRNCVIICGFGMPTPDGPPTVIQLLDLQGNLLFEGLTRPSPVYAEVDESVDQDENYYGYAVPVSYESETRINMAGYNNGLYIVLIRIGEHTSHAKVYIRNKGTAY